MSKIIGEKTKCCMCKDEKNTPITICLSCYEIMTQEYSDAPTREENNKLQNRLAYYKEDKRRIIEENKKIRKSNREILFFRYLSEKELALLDAILSLENDSRQIVFTCKDIPIKGISKLLGRFKEHGVLIRSDIKRNGRIVYLLNTSHLGVSVYRNLCQKIVKKLER